MWKKKLKRKLINAQSLNAIAVCFLHLSDEDGGDGAEHITLGEISRAKLKKNNFARLSACK